MALSNKDAKEKPVKKAIKKTEKPKRRLPLPNLVRRIGGYFKGSWEELRYTRWPTRKATWSLTLAVILFTAFIMLFIIGVDYVFNLLFKELIL